MAHLSLQNINKVYDGNVHAVKDVNLEINDGEFIVLVGPSGCGKSTTLRMVAGLEDITSGELYLDTTKMTNAACKDRDMAMVFQNYALYGHMTIYENLAFSLVMRKQDPNIIHEKVMTAAKILGLVDQLNKKPKQLSGGQRQRVAVGRAIVREPKVFLFDEPLSNLDAKLRGSMRRELKILHNALRCTMIYVTHDQIEALTLADRIVVMSDGVVQQVGTPIELYEKPANLFVASFIGLPPMNFIDFKVESGGVLSNNQVKIELPESKAKLLTGYVGKEIVLGIRPEHASEGSTHDFVVEIKENLGHHTLIHGHFGGKHVIFKLTGWCDYAINQPIKLDIDMDKTHFFDKATTNAITEVQNG